MEEVSVPFSGVFYKVVKENPVKKIWLNLYFLQICKLASFITNFILGKIIH